MKSPKDMKVIQIELTNACINRCSNCTRFCGWHQKPFFMDFQTFKKAVDSLQGFHGMIGIMGGQPTLHPQFSKFIDYLNQKFPGQAIPLTNPQQSFNNYRQLSLSNLYGEKKGLWSCLGEKYYQNFEQIQDTFGYQCINDHSNDGQHQALLVARKDLNISDNDFEELRNNCWIQNLWSASITPKGCFFCEVAAALDMLFDGEGGWRIEKDWWKRQPKDFKDQLHWCEYCSACLKVPSKKGNEGIDIISKTLYDKLKDKNAYKAKNKCYELLTLQNYYLSMSKINHSEQPYLSETDKRISSNNKSIIPHKINICFLNDQENNTEYQEISKEDLKNKNFKDWCIIVLNKNFELDQKFNDKVYNPGILYINQNFLFVNSKASSIKNIDIDQNIKDKYPMQKICYIGKFKLQNENIKYSFLVPTYNSSKTVINSLNSIIHQNYKNFDIFIVDDGSTDNTVSLVKQYQKFYPQLKIIETNKENSSAVISRNKLIDLADGDYSIWCDSDDEVNPNFCSLATYLLNQENFDIISFDYNMIGNKEQIAYWHKKEKFVKVYSKEKVFDYFMFKKPNGAKAHLWSRIIKTEVLKQSKAPNARIDLVDDHAFVVPLYYNCESYMNVNSDAMYNYYRGNGSWGKQNITFQKFKKNVDGIITAYIVTKDFLKDKNFDRKYYDQYHYSLGCLESLNYILSTVQQKDQQQAYNYLIEKFKKEEKNIKNY